MFTTLLESTPHRKPGGNTAVISGLFHAALIAAAVYATTSGAASKVVAGAAQRVTMIQWVKPSAQPSAPAPAPKPKPKSRPVVAPTKVPTQTPPIDRNAAPTTELETGPTSSTNAVGSGTPGAYNAFEVDVEVVALGGSSPRYPEGLRASGTEGQVIAQFIVNEKGRADQQSFKVISSTQPQFTDAVKRALPGMRFRPAQIAGKPVSQLVQQLFVFKLNQ